MEKVSPTIINERGLIGNEPSQLSKLKGILSTYIVISRSGLLSIKSKEDFYNKTEGMKLPGIISDFENVKDIINKSEKAFVFLKYDSSNIPELGEKIKSLNTVIKDNDTNKYNNYDLVNLLGNNEFKQFLQEIDSETREIREKT